MTTIYPIKHDDGRTDTRYTVTKEGAEYVARFCGSELEPARYTSAVDACKRCHDSKAAFWRAVEADMDRMWGEKSKG